MLNPNETARILADSITQQNNRFTTFLVKFPKCLLAELARHRSLTISSGSSRAVPFNRMLQSVIDDPYIPSFTHNQPGMQGTDTVSDIDLEEARNIWLRGLGEAVMRAEQLNRLGLHKQEINRLLEPYMYVEVIISGTEYEHFFNLRCAENVQPDFRNIALQMRELYDSNLTSGTVRKLNYGEWHIPFSDFMPDDVDILTKLKISIARCARVSYENHGGNHTVEKDIQLYDMLISQSHMSPTEHLAVAVENTPITKFINVNSFYTPDIYLDKQFTYTRQYKGFYTYRAMLEDNMVDNFVN